MIYLQPHNNRPYQRLNRIAAALGVFVVVTCTIVVLYAPHFFSSLFTTLARPFWRVEFSIESGSLKSPEQLLVENEYLKNQLEVSRVAGMSLKAIEDENAELKTVLGRNALSTSSLPMIHKNSDAGILAAVLIRPPVSAYDEVIVDVGKNLMISTSSLVYSVSNVLVGRVVDVLETTAKIKLFSSPGQKVQVQIGPERIPVEAVGRGGGQYEGEVSRESRIKAGDLVLSPYFNDRVFATVVRVLSDPAQTFETVLFSAPVNIYELRWVVIRKNI